MKIKKGIPRTYKGPVSELEDNQIFVFGSNTEGRHGAGSALHARKFYGAVYGQAYGLQGRSYAIITKNLKSRFHPSISKYEIIKQIQKLYDCAASMPTTDFLIAYGTGKNLNGYTPIEMLEMFYSIHTPRNIVFEEKFAKLL